jgi:hypothetical protein
MSSKLSTVADKFQIFFYRIVADSIRCINIDYPELHMYVPVWAVPL